MRVRIFGSQRTGKKSFTLASNDNECFRIEALKGRETTHFRDISSIDWNFSGESVLLSYVDGNSESIDFKFNYDKVNIIKTGRTTPATSNDLFNPTNDELQDIKRGLIIAMQRLYEFESSAYQNLSNRLELIVKKLP